MSFVYRDRGVVVNSNLLSKQLEKRVYAVPDAFLRVNGLSTPRNISPASCPKWSLRSVRWQPPYQKAAPGKCWQPESKTQHVQPVSPGEAFGIYPPGSVGPADCPATGNDSMTKGTGVISKLHALDLSCLDESCFRDQGAAAAISGSRYIGCLKSLTAKG